MTESPTSLRWAGDHWVGSFVAMACPCQALIDACGETVAQDVLKKVADEAWRVERKFSRYRDDNIVHQINSAGGRRIEVDEETSRLIDFGAHLTRASEGAFDLTSGVLRKVWRFDGGDRLPETSAVRKVLQHVGWHRVAWDRPALTLEAGMQIDFGGVGKEYAVDRAVRLIAAAHPELGVVVNLGGDLAVAGVRQSMRVWTVGIEPIDGAPEPVEKLSVGAGGIATSGDTRRFVHKDGRRYSHILDARTGWPVEGAPRSVTVLAATCTEAGTLSTLAALKGGEAHRFLAATGARYWIQ